MNQSMYNYSTSGGPIQEDFGAIGEKFLQGTRYVNSVRRAEQEKIQKQQEEIIKLSNFPLTGNSDVDQAAFRVTQGLRDDLMNSRKKVGVDGYTRADHNSVYTNAMSSAKTYSGINDYMKNEIDRVGKDESLSDLTKDLYMKSLGSMFNKDSVYDVRVNDGSIIVDEFLGNDKDGNPMTQETNVKKFMMNGGQDIEKFDPLDAFEELQELYMSNNQSFEYSVEDIAGNPALLTKHVTGNPEQFGTFLENYLDNFKNSDDKVAAFLYDEMGVKLGGEDGIKHKDGRINLEGDYGENLKTKAKENFKKYILDQVGLKEEGRFQFVPKKRTGGSGKYTPNMVVSNGGNIIPRGSTGYGDEFKFEDIAKSFAAGTEALIQNEVNEGIAIAYGYDEEDYKNVVNKDTLFVKKNSDLYFEGQNKVYEAPQPGTSENGTYPKNMTFDHLSLGLDLNADDFKESITSTSRQTFNAISGIVFSMEYVDVASSDPDGPKVPTPRPSGIRLVGPVTYQKTQSLGGSKEISTGSLTSGGTADVQEKTITGQSTSNLLSPNEVGTVLRKLYDENPNLEAYYKYLKQNNPQMNDVKALYEILQSLKS